MPEELDGFVSAIHIEVGATVTHPPGTTFTSDGKPIPPKETPEKDENK
jgi:hypothetical protein